MKKLCKFVGILIIGLSIQACGSPNTSNDDMNNMDDMDNMNDMDTGTMDTSTIDTTDSVALDPEVI